MIPGFLLLNVKKHIVVSKCLCQNVAVDIKDVRFDWSKDAKIPEGTYEVSDVWKPNTNESILIDKAKNKTWTVPSHAIISIVSPLEVEPSKSCFTSSNVSDFRTKFILSVICKYIEF